jgi:parallel beta-helix repeat protein
LSLDNSNGHVVGGPGAGAINVIAGNASMAIAPHNSDDLLIEGNYIGVGYDGTTSLGNGLSAINLSGSCNDAQISDNIIANSPSHGINIGESSNNALVQNNTISSSGADGVAVNDSNNAVVQNNTISSSGVSGVSIVDSSDAQIGGKDVGEGNTIENSAYGVLVIQTVGTALDNIVQGNVISTSSASGIAILGASNTVIGGAEAGAGNTITDSVDTGIAVASITLSVVPLTIAPQNTTILGNSITDSTAGPLNSGLGIDLFEATDTSGSPDFVPESFSEIGATLNDTGDSDTGPNNYMNYPVINSASQNLLNLNVNFDLDAADSPTDQYRVEFFANDAADPSGYGEGQTFLGSTTVSPGSDKKANLTLPTGTNLTGKVLSATTTAIDGTTTSGFGSTSEFSFVSNIDIIALPQEPTSTEGVLANTGQNRGTLQVMALLLIVSALGLGIALYRNYKFSRIWV